MHNKSLKLIFFKVMTQTLTDILIPIMMVVKCYKQGGNYDAL
jgi:hypothetical protein